MIRTAIILMNDCSTNLDFGLVEKRGEIIAG